MNRDRRKTWVFMVGVALMFVALFSYVATLDESDPDALPQTTEHLDPGLQ